MKSNDRAVAFALRLSERTWLVKMSAAQVSAFSRELPTERMILIRFGRFAPLTAQVRNLFANAGGTAEDYLSSLCSDGGFFYFVNNRKGETI